MLAERAERLEGGRLYAIEVAACTAIGDLQRGAEVLELGLRFINGNDRAAQLELLERGIELRAALQGDGPGVVDAARSTVALTDVMAGARGIQALTDAAAACRAWGATTGSHAQRRDLPALRPASTGRTCAAGRSWSGRSCTPPARPSPRCCCMPPPRSRTSPARRDSVFVEDSFALRRLLQQTSSDAEPALAALADEVGLDQKGSGRSRTWPAAR